MSASQDTFVEKCLKGDVLANEIDDVVDEWHDGDDPRTLREFLGFSEEEYACWVKSPSCVRQIIACRDAKVPFVEQEDVQWGMAARSNGSEDLVDITRWLHEE